MNARLSLDVCDDSIFELEDIADFLLHKNVELIVRSYCTKLEYDEYIMGLSVLYDFDFVLMNTIEKEEDKMDKIKAFFQKKAVKIVSWILLALGTIGLFVGGVTAADISKVIEMIVEIITMISALIAFISERCKKVEDKTEDRTEDLPSGDAK